MPIQLSVSEQRFFTDEFHAKPNVVPALIICVVAFGVWMLGVWMGDLHTSSKAIHAIGAVVAITGAVGSILCAWLSVRVWVVQHRQ